MRSGRCSPGQSRIASSKRGSVASLVPATWLGTLALGGWAVSVPCYPSHCSFLGWTRRGRDSRSTTPNEIGASCVCHITLAIATSAISRMRTFVGSVLPFRPTPLAPDPLFLRLRVGEERPTDGTVSYLRGFATTFSHGDSLRSQGLADVLGHVSPLAHHSATLSCFMYRSVSTAI